MAGLERELGVDLFARTTRSLHLTEPGATFYRHALGVLREVEEARNAVSAPRRPDELLQHECMIYSLQPSHHWFFVDAAGREVAVPVGGRVRADDSEPLRALALDGAGVVLLPSWLVGDDLRAGRLQRILPDWQAMIATQPSGIFGLYPPHRAVPGKVSAFLDFLRHRFGRPPYWERGLP